MNWRNIVSLLLCSGMFVFLTTSVSGSFISGAFGPADTAQESDLVIHGTVTTVEPSGGHPTKIHDVTHPVTIDVHNVFKGEAGNTIMIQVGGSDRVGISTAASFSEGEEVIVMLQKDETTPYREELYYPNSGEPGKYLVTDGTVEVKYPERKRITVEQMQEIVQSPTTVNITNLTTPNISEKDMLTSPDEAKQPTGAVTDDPVEQGGLLTQLWESITALFL